MEIPARHVRKGDCIIRDVVPGGRILVFVDYPGLGLTHTGGCNRPLSLFETEAGEA